ncbi:hypothetical protein SLEP1_g56876 [Rubroshorea leprosula]|uniref:Uncharacterized protein n=1 Tax=Rubroshorea leprosula TaxID=152421 RepID=A0AAV5MMS1_9ROSI|nr:hypothetical protein SLEP1_g56876 [Rubroshorea leprosula]
MGEEERRDLIEKMKTSTSLCTEPAPSPLCTEPAPSPLCTEPAPLLLHRTQFACTHHRQSYTLHPPLHTCPQSYRPAPCSAPDLPPAPKSHAFCAKSPAPFCTRIACTLHQPSPAIMPCMPEPSYPPYAPLLHRALPLQRGLASCTSLALRPIPCPCLLHTTSIQKKQPMPDKIGIID